MRFDFDTIWKKVKLGEILKIKSGMDQKKIETSDGKYNIYGTGGIIGKTNTPIYSKESVGIGRKGTIDKPFYFNEPFWTVDTLFYSEIKSHHVKFIYYLFQTINWKFYNQSTGVPSLTSSVIENININIPSSLEEERKIAIFLSEIDERISTQKKIINNYKSLINGLIKMYFPNKGLCEVGQTTDLNEILIEGNKISVNTKHYQKITVKLNKEGIAFSNLNREMSDTRPFYIRNHNEIIIGKQNYFNGSIAIIPEEYDNTICSNAIMSFKVKKDYNLKFIYYCISNDLFLKYRSHLANGTGQKELSEKDFLSFKIILPDENTQKKIVNNIEKISEKLQLEKKILFLYEQQKQYLLDKLFI